MSLKSIVKKLVLWAIKDDLHCIKHDLIYDIKGTFLVLQKQMETDGKKIDDIECKVHGIDFLLASQITRIDGIIRKINND